MRRRDLAEAGGARVGAIAAQPSAGSTDPRAILSLPLAASGSRRSLFRPARRASRRCERIPRYLSGGTGLAAYYLHHRRSDDLDFFTRDPGFEDLIALAKQKLIGLDDFTLAAHFKAVEDLPNLAEFQRDYMLVDIDLRELVRFFQEWAARLFSVLGGPSRTA